MRTPWSRAKVVTKLPLAHPVSVVSFCALGQCNLEICKQCQYFFFFFSLDSVTIASSVSLVWCIKMRDLLMVHSLWEANLLWHVALWPRVILSVVRTHLSSRSACETRAVHGSKLNCCLTHLVWRHTETKCFTLSHVYLDYYVSVAM